MKVSRTLVMFKLLLASILALVATLALSTRPLLALDFPVTNTLDNGSAGTLRDAINQANGSAGPDTISFSMTLPATIVLTDSLPTISEALTINGPITDDLTISGDEQFRAFTSNSGIALTILNLTIRDGRAANGGAIHSQGVLTLDGVRLFNNVATASGGAIYLDNAAAILSLNASLIYSNSANTGGGGIGASTAALTQLTLSNSEVYSNVAKAGSGGGLYLDNGGSATVTISDSSIYKNKASGSTINGGGIALDNSGNLNATITESQIYENVVTGSDNDGGGLFFSTGAATIHIAASEIYSNTAGGNGGGLQLTNLADATLTLSDTQVYSNVTGANGGGLSIFATTGADVAVTLTSSPIYANHADVGDGGGLTVQSQSGRATLTSDSPLWGNRAFGDGGGLYLQSGNVAGTAQFSQTEIYKNSSEDSGGGLHIVTGKLILQETNIYSNTAVDGGGVFLRQMTHLDATGGELRNNSATDDGGGLYVNGTAILTDTKFLSNSATDGGAIFQFTNGTTQATDGCLVNNNPIAVEYAGGTIPMNLTVNWWGASNGPGGNGPGDGDAVTSNVNFSNFKSAAPPGCPILPQQIEVAKSVVGIPAPNERVTYTLVISNSGSVDPTVTVTDILPAEVNFAEWLEQPTGAIEANDVITFTGAITTGEIITLSFAASFVGDYSDVVTNTAHYSATVDVGSAQAAFAATHLLTLSKDGNGSGTVSSDPSGINCGGDCSEEYDPGTVVTLTAVADVSSTFTGWSGACSGSGECAVTMDASKQVTATFTIKSYALSVTKNGSGTGTVTSAPPGINCGGDCSQTYTHGTVVTLTAVADVSSTFTGWSGACNGSGDCIVTMGADRQVTATFTSKSYALTVTKDGEGAGLVISNPSGISCGGDCAESYLYGTVVTLTAVPNPGSLFEEWDGDCSGTGACVVTMTSASEVNATFHSDITGLNSSNDGPTLLGNTTHFTASANGLNISYEWDFGDDSAGSGANPSHTYALPGEYIAAVTAGNQGDSEIDITIVIVTEEEVFEPPVAVNDAAATIENMAVSGNALDNDTDPQDSVLTVTDFDQPAHGTATVAANGDFTYTPLTGYVGVDFFNYTVSNIYDQTKTAMVIIVVESEEVSAGQPIVIVTTRGVTTTNFIEDGDYDFFVQVPATAYTGTLTRQDILFLVYTPLLTTTADLDAAPGSLRFGGLIFSLAIYLNNSRLNEHSFDPPLLLQIDYPATALARLDPDDLALLYWKPTSNEWATDGIEVIVHNQAARKVTIALHHLTDFALFSDPANQSFMPLLSKEIE